MEKSFFQTVTISPRYNIPDVPWTIKSKADFTVFLYLLLIFFQSKTHNRVIKNANHVTLQFVRKLYSTLNSLKSILNDSFSSCLVDPFVRSELTCMRHYFYLSNYLLLSSPKALILVV